MYLSYLWCSRDIEPAHAHDRFARILGEQRAMYSTAWGFPVELDIHQQGNILIGHLTIDSGVIGWRSWSESNGSGVVWNGVCENFLGTRFGEHEIQDVYRTLSQSTSSICDWDGNFYVISWDKAQDKVYLTTGATDCPTLWHTKGRHGWAAGSRGAPILEMVGHQKQLSSAACNIFMAYGYNFTDQSLFEHVQRIPQRIQVKIQPDTEPKLSRYSTLAEFIEPYSQQTDRTEILTSCADRLVNRIQRQLTFSSNPEILITGGRDSRCIAAAAKKAGYNGILSTGGAADSKDVTFGRQVAQQLGIPHRHTADRVPMATFGKTIDRLRLWSNMSEGTEVLRHARAYNCFVESLPPAKKRQQLFHGLGGEICRGYYYQNTKIPGPLKTSEYSLGRDMLFSAADPAVPLTREAKDLMESRLEEFTQDLGGNHFSVAQWLDIFFWQNSCLRWGSDMLSVKSAMYWAWTPFLDREFICRSLNLDPEDKCSNRFIQDLTLTLASELKGVEYDTSAKKAPRKRALVNRIFEKLRLSERNSSTATNEYVEATQFWEDILLHTQNPVWSKFLEEKMVRRIIYKKPSSEILWNAATVQLMSESYS